MTSLTDRYLAAVLRGIPERQRADLEREFRSSIEEAVQDRTAAGEERLAAEKAVLEAMGEPSRLAADLAGRPFHLIGPDLFLVYRHILVMLLATGVPIVGLVVAALKLAGGGDYWDALAAGVGGAWNAAVHMAFWVTATFAVVERADAMRGARDEVQKASRQWTVDMLPALPNVRVGAGEMVGELVTTSLTIGGILFLQQPAWFTDERGDSIPLFNPGLWDGWLPILIAVLVALAALQVMAFVVGRWNTVLAFVHAILQVAFAVPVAWLALSGALINPAFAEALGWPALADDTGPAMLLLAAAVVGITAWEIVAVFRRAGRSAASDGRPVTSGSA